MLLKRMDETIINGNYDLDAGSGTDKRSIYIVEPVLEKRTGEAPAEEEPSAGGPLVQMELALDGAAPEEAEAETENLKQEKKALIHWEIVEEGRLSRKFLHYDDIDDGSQTLSRTWQTFYASEKTLGKGTLYSGSNFYFKSGSPLFGGIAKAAVYLRYSAGFIQWLDSFDPEAAGQLRNEIPAFEMLIGNSKTKKLPAKWHDFKAPKGKWPLIEICKRSNGKRIVLWLNKDADDEDGDLAELGIDVEHSLKIMSFLSAPKVPEKEMINAEFQSGSGLGRNAFGKLFKLDGTDFPEPEYRRLMGVIPESSREKILALWSNRAEYRVKAAPSPDTSSLIFLPEGDLPYSDLKNFIDSENEKKRLFFEQKKAAKKKKNEDMESIRAARPDAIPAPSGSATVFLTNLEGSTKKKRIIQQVFPAVSLSYLQILNAELLDSNIQDAVVKFMKAALTGRNGKNSTPSIYRYWTTLFTHALQKQPLSALELYHNFQRFAKSYKGEDLIEKYKARDYFQTVGKVLRLQHLIATARTSPERMKTPEFQSELKEIETFNGIQKGVFGNMNPSNVPPLEEFLPAEVCGLLRDKQKSKLENFARQAWYGVPNKDFAVFVRGALIGMLLNELCYTVTHQERHFTATQGRHPSRLRGRELMAVFDKGIGLLINLEKEQLFNCRLLPFVKSMEMESRRDNFNSGLICGMVYWEKKENESNENSENSEVEND